MSHRLNFTLPDEEHDEADAVKTRNSLTWADLVRLGVERAKGTDREPLPEDYRDAHLSPTERMRSATEEAVESLHTAPDGAGAADTFDHEDSVVDEWATHAAVAIGEDHPKPRIDASARVVSRETDHFTLDNLRELARAKRGQYRNVKSGEHS